MTNTSKEIDKPNQDGLIKLIGRPPKYTNVEEVQTIIMEYLNEHCTVDDPPLMTGLAMVLGLSRQGLCEYSRKDMFSDTIKRAKQYVENINEKMLITKKTSPIGNIFNLKNNFAWRDDKQVILVHKTVASIMATQINPNEVIDGELLDDIDDEQLFLA